MDGARLSDSERRSLQEIETVLRYQAAGLDRCLREMRLGWCRRMWAACGWQGLAVAALTVVTAALLVAGARTSAPAAIWAFSVSWGLTVCAGFRLAYRSAQGRGTGRRTRRGPGRANTAGGDEG